MPSNANKDDRGQETVKQAAPQSDKPVVYAPPSLRRRAFLFAAIALAGAAVDIASKDWVFGRLWPAAPLVQQPQLSRGAALNEHLRDHGAPHWLWRGHFGFELSLNEGALFGFGQGFVWVFASVSVLAAGFIVYFLFKKGHARDLWLCVALSLVLGGIFGNLYDRLGLSIVPRSNPPQRIFAVRDWILVQYDDRNKWPNFNVADSLLVCGACMLMVQVFFRTPREDKQRDDAPRRPKAQSSTAGFLG